MNYKINRLVEYACLIYQRHDKFAKDVFKMYFKTYVDNYYYGVFDTIENGTYSIDNLILELEGAMEELLHNYLEYELEVSNSEYSENVFQIWRQGKLSEKQNLRNIAASRLAWQEVLKDVLKEHGSDGNRFLSEGMKNVSVDKCTKIWK